MEGVERKALHFAVGATDSEAPVNRVGTFAAFLSCCTDGGWCGNRSLELEAQGSDHLCKILRMRLGILSPDVRVTSYRSRLPSNMTSLVGEALRYKRTHRDARAPWKELHYDVRQLRADTLWARHVDRRKVDFLKVDMDRHWNSMGLEGLLEHKGFTLMSIEVDKSWGHVLRGWNLTAVDQLVWLARRHGYNSYLKVPCKHGATRGGWGWANDMESGWSAWLYPLANGSFFQPTAFHSRLELKMQGIHDLLLLDADERRLAAFLERRGQAECQTASASWDVAHVGPRGARRVSRGTGSASERLTTPYWAAHPDGINSRDALARPLRPLNVAPGIPQAR